MGLYDFIGDGQAEPGADDVRDIRAAAEPMFQSVEIAVLESTSLIEHGDRNFVVAIRDIDTNHGVAGRVFDGVINNVSERILQENWIAVDCTRIVRSVDLERDILELGCRIKTFLPHAPFRQGRLLIVPNDRRDKPPSHDRGAGRRSASFHRPRE